jgi:hypothetical protein
MSDLLYTFRCRNCWTVAITDSKPIAGHPERCQCGSWLNLLFTSPITAQDRALLTKTRMVYNPYAEPPQDWTCKRCDQAFPGAAMSFHRPDGRVCRDCYRAEEHPPSKLLTPEEVTAVMEARRKASRDYDTNHQFSTTGE